MLGALAGAAVPQAAQQQLELVLVPNSLLLLRRIVDHMWADEQIRALLLQRSALEARSALIALSGASVGGAPLIEAVSGTPDGAPTAGIQVRPHGGNWEAADRSAGFARRQPSRPTVAREWALARGRVNTTKLASIVGAHATNVGSVLEGLEAEGVPQGALPGRRLPILDLSPASHQPMVSAVAAGLGARLQRRTLRPRRSLRAPQGRRVAAPGPLRDRGPVGRDRGMGVQGAARAANDMFAFAAWDTRQWHLVRDRLGEKPLYWGWQGPVLLGGLELKPLQAAAGPPRLRPRGRPGHPGGLLPPQLHPRSPVGLPRDPQAAAPHDRVDRRRGDGAPLRHAGRLLIGPGCHRSGQPGPHGRRRPGGGGRRDRTVTGQGRRDANGGRRALRRLPLRRCQPLDGRGPDAGPHPPPGRGPSQSTSPRPPTTSGATPPPPSRAISAPTTPAWRSSRRRRRRSCRRCRQSTTSRLPTPPIPRSPPTS